MSKFYTIEQLRQLNKKFSEVTDSQFHHNGIERFLTMVEIRDIILLPPRDNNGRFIKPISNEDIYEAITNPNLKE